MTIPIKSDLVTEILNLLFEHIEKHDEFDKKSLTSLKQLYNSGDFENKTEILNALQTIKREEK